MKRLLLLLLAFLVVFTWPQPSAAQYPPARVPVILDTDLGSDIGDAFALGLILASPEFELRGVTTVGGDTNKRALLACRYLTMTGRRSVPVAAGADPQPERDIVTTGQYRYYYHPDVIFNRTTKPVKETAAEFIYSRIKDRPNEMVLIAAGPLTNIARLLDDKPDSKSLIKRVVFTASEDNLKADIAAVRKVLASGVPLTVVRASDELSLTEKPLRRVFKPATAVTLQMEALYQLWDHENPNLSDAFAVALILHNSFTTWEDHHLEIDDKGVLKELTGKANARVAATVKCDEFLKWYLDRMENCVAPETRPVKPISQGAMPFRVHVAEDYDNDIERFWWMSGKAELKNLLPHSKRACRGTLTHDFDDLLGNHKAMWTAVIFNPVPGPPMGKNPRLSFRYWLKGTSTLRVQIYTLTNNYHRHLIVKDLPQEKWESATVDMSLARRPDGTGGPLSEGERIDDIQFYVEPTAELIIDDVVLYDAASKDETRPFPKRIMFTGLFDTGKKEKDWPGSFEIVDGGFFWKAAKSVTGSDSESPSIRLHLRGERTLGEVNEVSFRYRLTGANAMKIALVNKAKGLNQMVELKDLALDKWAESTVRFTRQKDTDSADEIHFVLPKGAELLIDDLLLYEPGSK
jgi:inosine-uridine nucleoside N-ribohydrolase